MTDCFMAKVIDKIDGFYKRRFSALPNSFLEKKFQKKRKLTASDFSHIHASFQTFTNVELNVGSVVSGSKE